MSSGQYIRSVRMNRAVGAGQPVGFLALARRLVLEVQRQRAIRVVLRVVARLTVNLFSGLG